MINFDEYVVSYNKQAMIALKHDQVKVAYNLLNQAKVILQRKQISNFNRLLALTCNNLGCFYKRVGDFPKALKYFLKATEEGAKGNCNVLNLAGTHLNLCTLYSLVADHPKALANALTALKLLKTSTAETESYVFSMVMAYQNAAMEHENMSQYRDSLKFYKKALNYSLSRMGENNGLTKNIRERIDVLENKMSICTLGVETRSPIRKKIWKKRKVENSITPKIKRKINSNYSPLPLRKGPEILTKNTNINRDIVDEHYNYLSSFFTTQKKRLDSEVSRDSAVYSERPSTMLTRRVKTSIGSYRKKSSPRKNQKCLSNRKYKNQGKSPEVFPVPFRSKLSLFSTPDGNTLSK